MKIQGDEVSESIKNWIQNEISQAPTQGRDVGKFLFGVSTALVTIIVSVERLASSPKLDYLLIISIIAFLISLFPAGILIIPQFINLNEDEDLYELHTKVVMRSRRLFWFWLPFFSIGLILGVISMIF